jgi:hypothetical protein
VDVGEVVATKLDYKMIRCQIASVKAKFKICHSYREAHSGAIAIGEHLHPCVLCPINQLGHSLTARNHAEINTADEGWRAQSFLDPARGDTCSELVEPM